MRVACRLGARPGGAVWRPGPTARRPSRAGDRRRRRTREIRAADALSRAIVAREGLRAPLRSTRPARAARSNPPQHRPSCCFEAPGALGRPAGERAARRAGGSPAHALAARSSGPSQRRQSERMDCERHQRAPFACPSCGAVIDDIDGPTHPYLAAAPGCWASFGALQADEMTRFGYPPVHGLVVDAYAASHGGDGSDRRDRQSVCIHLMALCAVLEGEGSSCGRIALLQRLTAQKLDWPALHRPDGAPTLNHTHAAGATDLDDYTHRAREWAGAVWTSWSHEHDRVRCMLNAWSPRSSQRDPG